MIDSGAVLAVKLGKDGACLTQTDQRFRIPPYGLTRCGWLAVLFSRHLLGLFEDVVKLRCNKRKHKNPIRTHVGFSSREWHKLHAQWPDKMIADGTWKDGGTAPLILREPFVHADPQQHGLCASI
jgi:hypothetical protein